MTADARAVVLDLDGTLVDSVHHHVTAWHRALVDHGHRVPMARIHAGIGMGGDRLVPWLLGRHVAEAGAISDRHKELFLTVAPELVPTPGAASLLADLHHRGVPHVIATSADADERAAMLDALDHPDVAVVDSDDVASSKPAPDLLLAACDHVGTNNAVMVGDAPWDARAAGRAAMSCILVRCGGFGDHALAAASPDQLVDAPRDLVGQL